PPACPPEGRGVVPRPHAVRRPLPARGALAGRAHGGRRDGAGHTAAAEAVNKVPRRPVEPRVRRRVVERRTG
ncbi:hypothetical protein, partial [Streptomyces sp. NPDC060022]|uniref:hypothetical protein n=1 Tax=Streptomyces sp. NPDC060022 TaxID=3347039 RepID=UPI0036825B47